MSYTLLSTVTVGASAQTSIDFNSIPQIYTDLMVVLSVRNTGTYEHIKISVNGSSANISGRYVGAGGGGTPGSGVYAQYLGNATRDAYSANTFSNTVVRIANYSSTSLYKPISSESVSENNTSTTNLTSQVTAANIFASTAPITSLSFFNEAVSNLSQYSSASLYGIRRIPTASLGATPSVDYLVVAGGGAGGYDRGAGGGAGGLLTGSGLSVASGSAITVTVGAGGTGQNSYTAGTSGGSSVFSSISTVGGGVGNWGSNGNGTAGGSGGGGASGTSSTGGAGTAGQGFAGGDSVGANRGSGGGGGAGGVGESRTAANGTGGYGGPGLSSTLTGSTLYYAGGGGGGAAMDFSSPIAAGAGGIGGGGAGGYGGGVGGANGAPGTGGGGGGGSNIAQGKGGNGGSGIVIIRYPDTYSAPVATTGNPMVTYVNGYRVYAWTASGTITF